MANIVCDDSSSSLFKELVKQKFKLQGGKVKKQTVYYNYIVDTKQIIEISY